MCETPLIQGKQTSLRKIRESDIDDRLLIYIQVRMNQMNHKGTIPLQTERLLLRRFVISDVENSYNNWFSDPDVAFYMRWNAHTDIKQTEEMLSKFILNYGKLDFYRWAITFRTDNEVIGAIGFHIDDEFDMIADVSYTLGKKFWGQGVITEALKEVLRFGLLDVGINRIEAFHSINNPASGKVMKKSGMKYEGHSRQKYKSHTGLEDCDLYAIIRSDLSNSVL
jgi:Acetyltransferases, including N-acetylases of ribosomal proteins